MCGKGRLVTRASIMYVLEIRDLYAVVRLLKSPSLIFATVRK